MFEDTLRHASNEASVLGRTLYHAPAAIFDSVYDDLTKRTGETAVRTGESLGIGTLTGIALAKVPGITKVGLGGLAAYGVIRTLKSLGSAAVDAWDADSAEDRDFQVANNVSQIGRDGAAALETSVGFGVGGGLGMAASSRISALDGLATSVNRGVGAASEKMMFGPGVEKLPKSLMNADGSVNLVSLSNELGHRHPWNNVEVSRSVRLSDLKAGPVQEGSALNVNLFGKQLAAPVAEGRLNFHIHPPLAEEAGMKFPAARPSVNDVLFTEGTSMLRSGNVTTIYRGLNSEMLSNLKAGEGFKPQLDAVVYDPASRLAVQLKNLQDPVTRQWQPARPRFLDYEQTVKVLSRWDNDWSKIESIPELPLSSALDKRGATSLLKLGLYDADRARAVGSR